MVAAEGLGLPAGVTPFSDMPAVLSYGSVVAGLPEAVCGTGDSFVTNGQALDHDIIDMEAHPARGK